MQSCPAVRCPLDDQVAIEVKATKLPGADGEWRIRRSWRPWPRRGVRGIRGAMHALKLVFSNRQDDIAHGEHRYKSERSAHDVVDPKRLRHATQQHRRDGRRGRIGHEPNGLAEHPQGPHGLTHAALRRDLSYQVLQRNVASKRRIVLCDANHRHEPIAWSERHDHTAGGADARDRNEDLEQPERAQTLPQASYQHGSRYD
mmetsp:Transcript_15273/g.38791  ORF Transcript_15273/g.38791 Transcript_15273/m.38791 type:complete len:201 (-) Transcript_15273:242-844(-)